MFTFGHAIGVDQNEWDIESLEQDLDSPAEDEVVPALIVKLLYALTYDRKINIDNFEIKLRNQYVLRDPRRNPFGKEEELSRRWNQLGLSEKRIEPCGWDKSGNTYWLFDDNRLWVQKAPSAPPKPIKPIKEAPVKKPSIKTQKKAARGKRQAKPVKGDEDDMNDQVASHGLARSRGKATSSKLVDEIEMEDSDELLPGTRSLRKRARTSAAGTTTTRSGRVSKKNGQTAELSSPIPKRAKLSYLDDVDSPVLAHGRSTRASRRSGIVGDQWEPIPDEWLQSEAAAAAKGRGRRGEKGSRRVVNDGDDDSELSELSDVSMDPPSKERRDESDSDLTSVASSVLSVLSEPEDWPTKKDAPKEVTVYRNEGKPQDDQRDNVDDNVVVALQTPVNGETPLTTGSTPVTDRHSPMQVDEPMAEVDSMHHSIDTLPERQEDQQVKLSADDAQASLRELDIMSITFPDPNSTAEPKTKDATHIPSAAIANTETLEQEVIPQSEKVSDEAVLAQEEPAPTPDARVDVEPKAEGTSLNKVASPPIDQNGESSESKTVLQELAQEIEEAQEEEEYHDPKDEVMAIIRKAREVDPLEWKLVCSSRFEWEMFPKQFEQSKNPDEKAFYKHLVNNVLPGVQLAYRDKEIRWAKEEAVRNRKRSSRLVVKELERDAQRKAEESSRLLEERMQRVRDEEARVQAEDADRINKEKEREDRLREREERIREREERVRYRELEDIMAKERAERDREVRVQRRELGVNGSVSRQGSQRLSGPPSKAQRASDTQDQASSETWEVACEICHRQGWNIDEDRPIVACERCERWQHIDCHNRFDRKHGRPVRQWASIDFYCSDCSRKLAEERNSKQDHFIAHNEGSGPMDAPLGHITLKAQPPDNTNLASSPIHKSPRITIPAYAHGKSPVLMKAQPQLLSTTGTGNDALAQAHQLLQMPLMPTSAPHAASANVTSEPVNGNSSTLVYDSTPAIVVPISADKAPSFDLSTQSMHLGQSPAVSSTTILNQAAVEQQSQNTPYIVHGFETRQGPTYSVTGTAKTAAEEASLTVEAGDSSDLPLA
ncbi:hypothetical protein QFC22_000039 [Naganishia vaughanmartiniae]|uniref:Uncharacterized protein n=1 Tax=Naganishia vaughanmartiniae TaxID=1424756 RepID=A0ACC2XNZ8_9TREE|nr:hypothetical protein QFC22_000039 [Naganishia vaughanmartiniae]